MKKSICILLLLACVFSIVSCSAEHNDTNNTNKEISDIKITPMLRTETEIENVINEKLTDEYVEEIIRVFKKDFHPTFENYSVDKSSYIMKYCIGDDYWDSVESLDYDCLVEAFSDMWPKIIVPVSGDFKDSTGNVNRRVIGHLQLTYNWLNKDYTVSSCLYVGYIDNTNTSVIGYHNNIAYYLNENKLSAEKALIIKYLSSSSYTDFRDEIIVLKTETDTVVLDIGDTLQTSSEHSDRDVSVYSLSEYVPIRKEIKTNPAGGNVISVEYIVNSIIKIVFNNLLPYFIGMVVISVAVVVVIIVTKKYRKRNLRRNDNH